MNNIKGNIVDIFNDTIYLGEIIIQGDRIFNIKNLGHEDTAFTYYLPGFIDAHVHIESSLLTPSQFARMAVTHGTVATVSDPHEIANVCGVAGVQYMLDDGASIPFKFSFGVPSCVPATCFETAGAKITPTDIEKLLQDKRIPYLAEMMNYPGVLHDDPIVLEKLQIAQKYNKPIDGHAPGLRGENAKKYFGKGISTDHECFTLDEAEEKLNLGVKILIREGSAAKNFDALIPLAIQNSHKMMFCSDDKHPDSLQEGHINLLIKRAIKAGVDKFAAFRMASLNVVRHYNLDVGLMREGDFADFIEVDNLSSLSILSTFINGKKVAENGKSLISPPPSALINNFSAKKITLESLESPPPASCEKVRVIKVLDGQLITEEKKYPISELNNRDILKLVVYNRYQDSLPAIAYIEGFGINDGAIASSVAHDSHNIVAVGKDDKSIVETIQLIIEEKGGLSAVHGAKKLVLPLPIAGLMSNQDAYTVAKEYTQLDQFSKEVMGSTLKSPFMSLSFMALLVIPSLKLSDKGLFDGDKFEFTQVFY